jgi:hypothetical protein
VTNFTELWFHCCVNYPCPYRHFFHILVPYINTSFLFDTYGDFEKKCTFSIGLNGGNRNYGTKVQFLQLFLQCHTLFFIHPFPFFPSSLSFDWRPWVHDDGSCEVLCSLFLSAWRLYLQVSNRNNSLTDCTQVNNRIIMQVQLGKGGKMCMQLLMFLFLSKNS